MCQLHPTYIHDIQSINPTIPLKAKKLCKIFSVPCKDLPTTKTENWIETKGPPIHARARRLPPDKLLAAKAEFRKLLKLGIIRPSKSPWASPLHMVKKSDVIWRCCGDYRSHCLIDILSHIFMILT